MAEEEEEAARRLEEDVGGKMLRAMGWKKGEGLGKEKRGIAAPISVAAPEGREGLGKRQADEAALDGAAKSRKKLTSEYEGEELRVLEARGEISQDRASAVKAQNFQFYCQVCNKQYKTVAEFDGHLSSYDHHHRKRFAEMKEATKKSAPAVEERRRKESDREAKELERRMQAAAKAQPVQAPPEPLKPAAPFQGFSLGLKNKKPKPR